MIGTDLVPSLPSPVPAWQTLFFSFPVPVAFPCCLLLGCQKLNLRLQITPPIPPPLPSEKFFLPAPRLLFFPY